jgi:hypothetical protein
MLLYHYISNCPLPACTFAIFRLTKNRIILETEPLVLAQRVSMRDLASDVPLSEQTLTQALSAAKEQFTRSFLKGGL